MSRPADIAPLNAPTPDLVARFIDIVGPTQALVDPAAQAPYLKEWRDRYVGKTPLVVRPGSVEEVSRILALANEARIGIVAQAGNTGLVGGQIPFEDGRDIVLSIARLNRIRHVDPSGQSLIAEAGVTLASAQQAAEDAGRLFPLSLAAEGSCQIGGNLATNAGGVNVLAYGNARALALGLEVVLADGRIWSSLKSLKKDNTGYDLKDLFIGSEGTLGIITAATLKLFARPAEKATAFAALDNLDQVLDLFKRAETAAGMHLTAFEFICRNGVEIAARHVAGVRSPFATIPPWSVLIEISSNEAGGRASDTLERLLGEAIEAGIIGDAAIAQSLQQARDFWRLREEMSDAQKHEGGSIKHDISVAPSRIPQFIGRANALIEKLCPGARPVPFGHFGDGNVHYNVTQPVGMDKSAYLARWEEIATAVHALVVEMEGSISAEHGIGRMKRDALRNVKSAVEIDMMRTIKAALDPNGILNPGKVV
ncbi:MAG TPA: FAD-binding oxidoreductase [Hyphomicrobiaceae bacterium]|nr:FAD-binding oxidoreductase [Hyphomicrobiaceae bacterium]